MLIWYAQELPSSCVAACVRMVFGGLGAQVAETQIQLSQAGATALLLEDWSLDDLRDALRAGYHPIVGVERHLLGYARAFHAVVLVEISSAAVTVLDPLDGPEPRRYGVATFALAWEAAGREALVIKAAPPTP